MASEQCLLSTIVPQTGSMEQGKNTGISVLREALR